LKNGDAREEAPLDSDGKNDEMWSGKVFKTYFAVRWGGWGNDVIGESAKSDEKDFWFGMFPK
jgi:hypothetical protein